MNRFLAMIILLFTSTYIALEIHQAVKKHSEKPRKTIKSQAKGNDLILALSWQPAFCERKSSANECQKLNAGLLPTAETQLSLHGLWPQPKGNFYCGVAENIQKLDKSGRWAELPAPELTVQTAHRLAVAMPGTASYLDRHEWIKHGTCYFGEGNGQEYYADTLHLQEAINQSKIVPLFVEHIGATLSTDKIRDAFDTVFGEGVGDRVRVRCSRDQGRTLIQELHIALKGDVKEKSDLGSLIRAANPLPSGCSNGIIDAAGLQ